MLIGARLDVSDADLVRAGSWITLSLSGPLEVDRRNCAWTMPAILAGMSARDRWLSRSKMWQAMPLRSQVLFLVGVFCLFMPSGLLADIPAMGANGPVRLTASAISAGAIAMTYVVVASRWPRWLVAVATGQVLWLAVFNRLFGAAGGPLTGPALHARLNADVGGATTSIVIGFSCLSAMIRRESSRFGQVQAEIALARDIHRHLVPRVERRISGFEFRGVSVPSGDVGGDLIDVVDSPDGWTAFVADVSGHGVAAGLLMGMVKSAARTDLRERRGLGELLTALNAVLFNVKGPSMFATFAGLQCTRGGLQFSVAGHLPILRCRATSGIVAELSIPQVPIAMFEQGAFLAQPVVAEPGDLFVILTDGFTEVFDRRESDFGLERVKSLIQQHAQAPLAAIEERLFAAVRAHGRQIDDQTLLLIRAGA
jgi:serine phosphatase RsbU (regulator of sigma subunit)